MAIKNGWFPHDADASSDLKLVYIKSVCGLAGMGIYWELLQALRRADGYELPFSDFHKAVIAQQIGATLDEFSRFIVAATDENVALFTIADGIIFSAGLKKRMARMDERNAKEAERIAAKRAQKSTGGNVGATGGNVGATKTQNRIEENRIEDIFSSSSSAREKIFEKNDFSEDECFVLPPIPPPPPPAEAAMMGMFAQMGARVVDDFDRFAEQLEANDHEIAELCRRAKVPDKTVLIDYLKIFVDFKKFSGQPPHKSLGSFIANFQNWIPSERKKRQQDAANAEAAAKTGNRSQTKFSKNGNTSTTGRIISPDKFAVGGLYVRP